MSHHASHASPSAGPRRVAIIGGGISGLAVAWGLQAHGDRVTVDVYDAGPEPGGTARTRYVDGFTVDLGPNGFLTHVPETLRLVASLGMSDSLVTASDAANHRFLWHRNRLEPLPLSPGAFLRTPLLGWRAKLRVLCEPFLPRGGRPDETVWAFVARRLGRGFADAFVAPMVLGVTGGDARRVELRSLFPKMAALEAEHGGLFRALLVRRLRARRDARALPAGESSAPDGEGPGSGPAGPGGRLTSLRGGVGALARGLADALGDRVHLDWPVAALQPEADGRWRMTRDDGATALADEVVLAVPAQVAARLLRPSAPVVADHLSAIPASDMTMVALGYAREDVPHPLDGFGFLAPRDAGLRILGCLWASTLYPEQAPEGHVLLRTMLGGDVDPGLSDLDDAAVVEIVRHDLRKALGVTAEPCLVQTVRWRNAIPQYRPGHGETVAQLDRLLSTHAPGIHLTGNSYRGVGLNDCTRDAERVVRAIARPDRD